MLILKNNDGVVTDWGGKDKYPLEYRFHSAMMGSLGIGADLNSC